MLRRANQGGESPLLQGEASRTVYSQERGPEANVTTEPEVAPVPSRGHPGHPGASSELSLSRTDSHSSDVRVREGGSTRRPDFH